MPAISGGTEMSEGSKDLFGKIDALFEKRAPDALVDKGLEYEDFPVLTEVVGKAPEAQTTWGDPERRVLDRRALGPATGTSQEKSDVYRRGVRRTSRWFRLLPRQPMARRTAGKRALPRSGAWRNVLRICSFVSSCAWRKSSARPCGKNWTNGSAMVRAGGGRATAVKAGRL